MTEMDYFGIIDEAYGEVARRIGEQFWEGRIITDFTSSNTLLYSKLFNAKRDMFDILDKNR